MLTPLSAAFVLLAAPSQPDFHFGAGASWVHIGAEQYCCSRPAGRPDGLGLSLEGQLDYGRFFLAASVAFAQGVLAGQGTDVWAPQMAIGRIGYLLLDAPVAPYLAAGAGWLRELLPDGDSPPNMLEGSGGALLAEAGVQAWRGWRNGRAVAFVHLLQPLFSDPASPGHPTPSTKTCWQAGLRILY